MVPGYRFDDNFNLLRFYETAGRKCLTEETLRYINEFYLDLWHYRCFDLRGITRILSAYLDDRLIPNSIVSLTGNDGEPFEAVLLCDESTPHNGRAMISVVRSCAYSEGRTNGGRTNAPATLMLQYIEIPTSPQTQISA